MGVEEWSEPSRAEARAVGLGAEWPYMPREVRARRQLVDWAAGHRLRYSRRGQCVAWLRRGQCPGVGRGRAHLPGSDELHAGGGWRDHVSGWTRGGKPAVLIAAPYGLTVEARGELDELAATSDLRVEIEPGGGWYGLGTTFVGIWRQEP